MGSRPLHWSADVHVEADTALGAEVITPDDRPAYVRVYIGGDDCRSPVTVYVNGTDVLGRLIRHLDRALLNMEGAASDHDDDDATGSSEAAMVAVEEADRHEAAHYADHAFASDPDCAWCQAAAMTDVKGNA